MIYVHMLFAHTHTHTVPEIQAGTSTDDFPTETMEKHSEVPGLSSMVKSIEECAMQKVNVSFHGYDFLPAIKTG